MLSSTRWPSVRRDFSEWTLYALYALYVLDVLHGAARVSNGSARRWAAQVHSRRDMEQSDRYDYRIVHFAWKELGASAIIADLDACGRLPRTVTRLLGPPRETASRRGSRPWTRPAGSAGHASPRC